MNPLAHTLLQTLTDAIAVGSLYALIALGYTLVFGILKFINFAHGDVFALGAWLTWYLATRVSTTHAPFNNPIVLAIFVPVGAVVLCAVVGFLIEFLAYKPLRDAPRLNVLITAIGVSLFLENAGQLFFGAQPQEVPLLLPDKVLAIVEGVRIHLVDVTVVATAIVLMIGMDWLVYRTRLGAAMRAVSFNINTAALMGIRVNSIVSITFVIGSALAGAAGFLFAMKHQLHQTSDSVWLLLGMKAFIAAVVGGIGSVRGAVLGGLLIGLIENFGVQYLSSDYRDVYVFLILILVLLVRPTGILGSPMAEKV
ncbi:MAG TPA: branched-chain amino acid ABC transporter permease [Tepidisphaeraceae bacterium]|nr:branched-chain amino acid ABC transporter permease [Tepidisphaeraceae bacterium]